MIDDDTRRILWCCNLETVNANDQMIFLFSQDVRTLLKDERKHSDRRCSKVKIIMEIKGLHVERNPLQEWLKIIIYFGITLILVFGLQRLFETFIFPRLLDSVGDFQIASEILINLSQGMVGMVGILVTWAFLKMDNLDFTYIGLKWRQFKDESFHFLAAASIVLPALIVTVSLEYFFGLVQFQGPAPSIFPIIAIIVAFLGIGIGEEIIYRGYIYRKAKELLNKPTALILSSFFFGMIHIVTWSPSRSLTTMFAIAISAFFIGAVFTMALEMANTRLLFPIYMHGWWNMFLFVYRASFTYKSTFDIFYEVFSVFIGCVMMTIGLIYLKKMFPDRYVSLQEAFKED